MRIAHRILLSALLAVGTVTVTSTSAGAADRTINAGTATCTEDFIAGRIGLYAYLDCMVLAEGEIA